MTSTRKRMVSLLLWARIGNTLDLCAYLISLGRVRLGSSKTKKRVSGDHTIPLPTNIEKRMNTKPAPPLIPPRMIKKTSWVLKSANYMQTCTLTNGWEIHFFL